MILHGMVASVNPQLMMFGGLHPGMSNGHISGVLAYLEHG
jgi:hypothetical protein